VLVDALYHFLQGDLRGQDDLAGDAEAELAGFGVAGAGERVVRPQQRLPDEVFRRSGLPAGTGRRPDRHRPGHVGVAELVLGEKAVQVFPGPDPVVSGEFWRACHGFILAQAVSAGLR
jgi:hypothetical protein